MDAALKLFFFLVFILFVRVLFLFIVLVGERKNFNLDLFNTSVFDLKHGKSYVFKHDLAVLALLREIAESAYDVTRDCVIIALREILADYFVKFVYICQPVNSEGCFVYL